MDGEGHGLSLVTLLVGAVALTSYLMIEPVPQSGRPAESDGPTHINAHSQDIPARLWQDPFEVIIRQRAASAHENTASDRKNAGPHSASTPALLDDRQQDCTRFDYLISDLEAHSQLGSVLVVPVIVPGGNYPEIEEHRRRVRYAVISGLIRSAYEPEQSGHIGYVEAPDRDAGKPDNTSHPRNRRQQIYPYEWFRQVRDHDYDAETQSLLVVWVNEDLLGNTPISTFA